ncbi:Thiolase, N-terminal domain-containing protein [Mucidula mucida]|nr:Thiolase, N-terminal domain-containing protein [Mucidula mucida]
MERGVATLTRKNPDDVVITLAIRSPLCKSRKGGFKDARTDELMLEMFKQVLTHSHLDPALVGDICVGNVLAPDEMYHARAAMLAAGFPDLGLMAVTTIANQIRSGQIEIGLALGVESMSESPDNGGPTQSDLISCNPASSDCPKPMGWTSENVADEFNVSRQEQDAFAAESFQRAERAQKAGYFENEIVPFTVYQKDASGERKQVVPAFPQWGRSTTTGGNASQITDGAAAVLLMTRRKAEELGLNIIGKHITTSVAGLPPRIMGIGPLYAIPMALKSCGLSQDDVDLFEVSLFVVSQHHLMTGNRSTKLRPLTPPDE